MSNSQPVDLPDTGTAGSASAPADESKMLVASAERLQVSTRRVPARRARMEKYLVTETHTVTMELTHEQVRLVYEPISDQARPVGEGKDVDQPDVARDVSTEGQRWLTLHREQVQLTTVVLPVERVRLKTYQNTAQQVMTEDVRREQIDTQADRVPAPYPTAD